MKTTLLAILCMALSSFSQSFAQPCDFSNVLVQKVYTGTNGESYADVTFDLQRNNGNKFLYLHFWTIENFNKVDKEQFSKGAGPKYDAINGTISNQHTASATIVINNDDPAAPVWNASNYIPDPTVITVRGKSIQVSPEPVSGNGSKALYRYTITAVPLSALGVVYTANNIAVMMWSTQSNSVNSHNHCSQIGYAAGQALLVNGTVSCAMSQYNLSITNTTGKTISGNIDVYASNGNKPADNNLNAAMGDKFDGVSYFVVEPNKTVFINRAIPPAVLGHKLFAKVIDYNQATQIAELLTASCSTLPIILQNFSATRSKQQVAVKWQTASEQGVHGFNVLRQVGNKSWALIGFVPSKAAGGYSDGALSYDFVDQNAISGASQYRLQEISKDGKTVLHEIKLVQGEEQAAKVTIYPNPSSDGKVLVAFDNASVRDIIVMDGSGRIIKQLKGVTANTVTIEQLPVGFYNIRSINLTTNESAVARLIVNK